MTRPKHTTFEIATSTPGGKAGRATRKGYVLGVWAAHREPGKGVYFWSFTHVPTGTKVSTWGVCVDSKAGALAMLDRLNTERLPE